MHAVSENPHRLVVTHDSSRFARVLAVLALAGVGLAAWRWSQGELGEERFWGAVGATAVFGLAALVCFERSRFVVDSAEGVVEWRRRRFLFGGGEGRLPFSEVRGVVSERPLGRDRRTRRVVLHTTQGDVPVTYAYVPDLHDVALGLALKIRMMIGLSADLPLAETVWQPPVACNATAGAPAVTATRFRANGKTGGATSRLRARR